MAPSATKLQNVQSVLFYWVTSRWHIVDPARVSQRQATGWTIRNSNSVRAKFSVPVQTSPGVHPASCTMSIGALPWGKVAGAWR